MRVMPVCALKTPTRVLNAHAPHAVRPPIYAHTRNTNIAQAYVPALIRVREGARPIFYRSCTHNRRVQTAHSCEVTAQPPIWNFFC